VGGIAGNGAGARGGVLDVVTRRHAAVGVVGVEGSTEEWLLIWVEGGTWGEGGERDGSGLGGLDDGIDEPELDDVHHDGE